jgi:hypothetical protein
MFFILFKIFLLSLISGVLGRLGGRAKNGAWYDFISDTKARDLGCALIFILTLPLKLHFWYIYLIVFGLMFGALTTYWDKLFGFDNLWFSGFMVGLAALPLLFTGLAWYWLLTRALILAVAWGCLNRFLPDKILIWERVVVEEFTRYFLSG